MVKRFLRRLDLRVTHWSRSTAAQRVRLLRHTGVAIVLDVGANEGQYARGLRDAGYEGLIISCEPIESVFRTLEAGCARDERWKAHRVALGMEEGEADLRVAASSAFSSFLPVTDTAVALDSRAAPDRTERVPLTHSTPSLAKSARPV